MKTLSHVRRFGNVHVPYTASWTAEESFYLDRCPYFGRMAIMQRVEPGAGKPLFGKPHACRQRETIARGLCDLCRRPLKVRTKVSLSHARPQPHSAKGWEILQVEPMLHRECALISMRHCPSLRRDADNGTLCIRQVQRWAVQAAIMDEVYTESVTGIAAKVLGHAKVQLIDWTDRNLPWLEAA